MPALETSGLTPDQSRLIDVAADSRTFLEGFYGTGKTTAGVAHMEHVLQLSKPRGAVLVLIPQRSLGVPYYDALRSSKPAALSQVSILTIYGLARRSIDLFWPLVGEAAGFARPDDPPTFLTIETAQYFMAKVAGSLLADGYFEGVALSPTVCSARSSTASTKQPLSGSPTRNSAAGSMLLGSVSLRYGPPTNRPRNAPTASVATALKTTYWTSPCRWKCLSATYGISPSCRSNSSTDTGT